MKKHKIIFRLIKKLFIRLLTSILSASNEKCMTQTTLSNLHSNKYCQKLHYCPVVVKLDMLD